MKKIIMILLALALMMSLTVPVLAEDSRETSLSFEYIAAPTYTVSIPGRWELSFGRNYLPIELVDAENLGGQSVVVTFEGTQETSGISDHYWLRLKAGNSELDNGWFPYILFDEFGNVVASIYQDYLNSTMLLPGLPLVTFEKPMEKLISLEINEGQTVIPNEEYTGYIIFGIKLLSP